MGNGKFSEAHQIKSDKKQIVNYFWLCFQRVWLPDHPSLHKEWKFQPPPRKPAFSSCTLHQNACMYGCNWNHKYLKKSFLNKDKKKLIFGGIYIHLSSGKKVTVIHGKEMLFFCRKLVYLKILGPSVKKKSPSLEIPSPRFPSNFKVICWEMLTLLNFWSQNLYFW